MEAIAAIALAGNVLQFVETGIKMTNLSKEILNSKDGTPRLVQDLATYTDTLRGLAGRMSQQDTLPTSPLLEKEVGSLQALAAGCLSFLSEVESVSNDLKQLGKHSRLKALMKASKIMYHRQTITELLSRIQRYKEQIAICILELVLDQGKSLSGAIRQLSDDSQSRYTSSISALQAVSDKVDQVAQCISKLGLDQIDDEAASKYVSETIEEGKSVETPASNDGMVSDVEAASSYTISTLSHSSGLPEAEVRQLIEMLALANAKHMHSFAQLVEARACQASIIQSLWFETITARFEQILEAHKQTFRWVFMPSSNFYRWLQFDTGIFWITGKAGCGKSTLVKHIFEHQDTHSALAEWAADKPVVTAHFYFWRYGNEMQKSLHGLLKSLLFQIFDSMPALIPILVPKRWKARHQNQLSHKTFTEQTRDSSVHHWSIRELEEAISLCPSQGELPLRMCFFIDGLDEYEGNHRNTITLLQKLATSPDLKICVSSRPENIFQLAFGNEGEKEPFSAESEEQRHIVLHDLTRQDIEQYVRTNLSGNGLFCSACARDEEHGSFILDIVKKAEGVFLWVRLAVFSLLDGLENGDTISEIKNRLDELPTELEDLFRAMMQSVEPRYKLQADQIFLFCMLNKDPLPLLAIPHVDNTPVAPCTNRLCSENGTLKSRVALAKRRLNSRCRGLMETKHQSMKGTFGAQHVHRKHQLQTLFVYPIHRTVWEFLEVQLLNDTYTRQYRDTLFKLHKQGGLLHLLRVLFSCNFDSIDGIRAVIRETLQTFASNNAHDSYFRLIPIDISSNIMRFGRSIFEFDWCDSSEGIAATLSVLDSSMSDPNQTGYFFRPWHSYFTLIASDDALEHEARYFINTEIGSSPSFGLLLQSYCIIRRYGYKGPLCSLINSFVRQNGLGRLQETSCMVRVDRGLAFNLQEPVKSTKLNLSRAIMILCPNEIEAGISIDFPIADYLPLLKTLLSLEQPFEKSSLHESSQHDLWSADVLWIEGTIGQIEMFHYFYSNCSEALPPILQLYLAYGANPNRKLSHTSFISNSSRSDESEYREPRTPWALFLHWVAQEHKKQQSEKTWRLSIFDCRYPDKSPAGSLLSTRSIGFEVRESGKKRSSQPNDPSPYQINSMSTPKKAAGLLLSPWVETIRAFVRAGARCQDHLPWFQGDLQNTNYGDGVQVDTNTTRFQLTALDLIESWITPIEFAEIKALALGIDSENQRSWKRPKIEPLSS